MCVCVITARNIKIIFDSGLSFFNDKFERRITRKKRIFTRKYTIDIRTKARAHIEG